MPYVKQDHPERKCDRCGETFKPKRAWQAFCCPECKSAYRSASVEYCRAVKLENESLINEVKRLQEELAVVYEQQKLGNCAARPQGQFRYDDEDQSVTWKED